MENQSVRTVHVNMLKVAVRRFSPIDNTVLLEIFFDAGKIKSITRTTRLGDANLLSMKLIDDLIRSEMSEEAEFDGESLRGVDIVLENEQAARPKLIDFFRTLHSKAQKVRNSKSADGYIDLIRSIQGTELVLYE